LLYNEFASRNLVRREENNAMVESSCPPDAQKIKNGKKKWKNITENTGQVMFSGEIYYC